MKKLINKLVKLLEKYKEYCLKYNITQHDIIRLKTGENGDTVSIYICNYQEDYHVVLFIGNDLEISTLYGTRLTIDVKVTLKELEAKIKLAEEVLEELKTLSVNAKPIGIKQSYGEWIESLKIIEDD